MREIIHFLLTVHIGAVVRRDDSQETDTRDLSLHHTTFATKVGDVDELKSFQHVGTGLKMAHEIILTTRATLSIGSLQEGNFRGLLSASFHLVAVIVSFLQPAPPIRFRR